MTRLCLKALIGLTAIMVSILGFLGAYSYGKDYNLHRGLGYLGEPLDLPSCEHRLQTGPTALDDTPEPVRIEQTVTVQLSVSITRFGALGGESVCHGSRRGRGGL
jgi:hypothetical protein